MAPARKTKATDCCRAGPWVDNGWAALLMNRKLSVRSFFVMVCFYVTRERSGKLGFFPSNRSAVLTDLRVASTEELRDFWPLSVARLALQ